MSGNRPEPEWRLRSGASGVRVTPDALVTGSVWLPLTHSDHIADSRRPADIVANDFRPQNEELFSSTKMESRIFDSLKRQFGFYCCPISLAGRLDGDFCNTIWQDRT
jgi:hypothetical protein